MELTLFTFLIGFFLMNAMPHLLFGLLRIRFFSLFGFSAAGNLAYAAFNIAMAMLLFHLEVGLSNLINNGVVLGAGAMLLIYLITGRFFYNLFNKNTQSS